MENWKELYKERLCTAEEAVGMIKSGDHVVFSHCAAEPTVLIDAMIANASAYRDVTIHHMQTLGPDLDLQTEAGFVLVPLDDALEGCRAAPQDDGFLLYTETRFCLISRAGEVLISSEGRVVETGARLIAEVPFHDSRGHAALCEWERGELAACSLKTALPPVPQTFALALFESVLLGLDPSPFLAPELDGDALREYLGEFVSVVLTDEENRVGLVFPRRERIYDVRYFTVETDGRRVVNIVAQ